MRGESHTPIRDFWHGLSPKARGWTIGIAAFFLFFILVRSASDQKPNQPSVSPSSSAQPSTSARNSPAVTTSAPGSFGDGTKIVGRDIKPGTYRTRVRAPGCYWARLAGFSGELGDILANGNETGPVIVTIRPGDKGFDCRQCGIWTPDLSTITTAKDAPFTDGVYIVNVDIEPGIWRADQPEGCYWSRLRGFTGELGEIISNENGKGLVTIAKTDKGFKSVRCGTWTKIK